MFSVRIKFVFVFFQLELKDISLLFEPTAEDETFAYEMYKIPDFWAGY